MTRPDSDLPPDPRERLIRRAPPFLLSLLPLILVYGAPESGEMLYGQDVVNHFHYVFGFVGRTLAEGRLPLWDPHTMAGFPLTAAMLAAVFYPFTWLSAVLPPAAFWSAAVAGHLILAGLFTYAWLGRGLGAGRWAAFVGALVFMLAGPPLSLVYAGHPGYLFAYAWLPAVAWRLERLLVRPTLKRGTLLGLALALLVLAGAAQYALFAGILVLARLAFALAAEKKTGPERLRAAAWVAGAAAGAALFAAPQLLLTLELLPHTQRVMINKYDFVTSFSLPPAKLLTFLVPDFFADPVTRGGPKAFPHLEACGYAGLGALALAFTGLTAQGRRGILWSGLALLGVLLALGRHSPVFTAAFHVIPGVDLFRAPVRYLALFTLGLAPLAAAGFDRLRRADDGTRKDLLRALAGTGSLAACLLLLWFFVDPVDGLAPHPQGEAGTQARASALAASPQARAAIRGHRRAGLLWASVCGAGLVAMLFARRRGILSPRAAALATGLLIAVELVAFGHAYFRGYPAKTMEWPPEIVASIRSHPRSPLRIVSPGNPTPADIGRCRLSGLSHLAGYEAMLFTRYVELMNVVHECPPAQTAVLVSPGRPHPVLDLLGARLWFITPPAQPLPGWEAVGRLGTTTVFEATSALPRAFLVGKAVVLESRDSRLRVLADPGFNPRAAVILEETPPGGSAESGGPAGAAALASHGPGFYQIDADTPGGGYLVLAETYFPGWEATVNGRPAPILRANHLIQAIRLPPGRHRVEFSYRSRFLPLGIGLSAGLAALLGAAAILPRLRRKPAPPGQPPSP